MDKAASSRMGCSIVLQGGFNRGWPVRSVSESIHYPKSPFSRVRGPSTVVSIKGSEAYQHIQVLKFFTVPVTGPGVDKKPGETDSDILPAIIDAAQRGVNDVAMTLGSDWKNWFLQSSIVKLESAQNQLTQNPGSPWLPQCLSELADDRSTDVIKNLKTRLWWKIRHSPACILCAGTYITT